MAYCTTADVKNYLGITEGTDDALLAVHIAAAQAAVDTYCRRTFEAAADATKYVDAAGDHVRGRTLYIDHIGELCSITSITNGDGVVLSSSEYVTDPRNKTPYFAIRLLNSSGRTWTYSTDIENAITIVGRWAYSTTAPADVAQACIRWASYIYRQKDSHVFDVTAIPEAGVVSIPQGLPKDVEILLRPYRRVM